jgi:hypothetical protein
MTARDEAVQAVAEADGAHLLWRGMPQHKPTEWHCSGCGFVAPDAAGRTRHRSEAVVAVVWPLALAAAAEAVEADGAFAMRSWTPSDCYARAVRVIRDLTPTKEA